MPGPAGAVERRGDQSFRRRHSPCGHGPTITLARAGTWSAALGPSPPLGAGRIALPAPAQARPAVFSPQPHPRRSRPVTGWILVWVIEAASGWLFGPSHPVPVCVRSCHRLLPLGSPRRIRSSQPCAARTKHVVNPRKPGIRVPTGCGTQVWVWGQGWGRRRARLRSWDKWDVVALKVAIAWAGVQQSIGQPRR